MGVDSTTGTPPPPPPPHRAADRVDGAAAATTTTTPTAVVVAKHSGSTERLAVAEAWPATAPSSSTATATNVEYGKLDNGVSSSAGTNNSTAATAIAPAVAAAKRDTKWLHALRMEQWSAAQVAAWTEIMFAQSSFDSFKRSVLGNIHDEGEDVEVEAGGEDVGEGEKQAVQAAEALAAAEADKDAFSDNSAAVALGALICQAFVEGGTEGDDLEWMRPKRLAKLLKKIGVVDEEQIEAMSTATLHMRDCTLQLQNHGVENAGGAEMTCLTKSLPVALRQRGNGDGNGMTAATLRRQARLDKIKDDATVTRTVATVARKKGAARKT